MKTNSKKWLKRLGIFLGTLILIVVGYVVYVFSSYYRLEDKQKLTITGKSTEKAKTKKSYRITSGNIGFGAYSDDYSFFMDGGKESRARSKDAVIENVSSYAEAVAQLNPDFMLFQEVDIDGTRSYHVMNANYCFHRYFQPITPHEITHLLRTMTALICSIRFWSHTERTNPVCLQFLT